MMTNTQETNIEMVREAKEWLDHKIRYGLQTVEDEPEPLIWFVANDIYEALGIKKTGIRKLTSRLKERFPDGVTICHVTDSLGRDQQTAVILEDVVYTHVVAKSTKPEAIKFQRWVGRVIRTVRQTGKYSIAEDRQFQLELRKVQIRERDQQMRLVTLVGSFDDIRMQTLSKELAASLLEEGAPSLKPQFITVSEIMQTMFQPAFVLKHRSSAGRLVAKIYKSMNRPIGKVQKNVNGHLTKINAYPVADREMIHSWLIEHFSTDRS